nr:MAG TPA: hypothetical protein [Caudoviricetes sp.]
MTLLLPLRGLLIAQRPQMRGYYQKSKILDFV